MTSISKEMKFREENARLKEELEALTAEVLAAGKEAGSLLPTHPDKYKDQLMRNPTHPKEALGTIRVMNTHYAHMRRERAEYGQMFVEAVQTFIVAAGAGYKDKHLLSPGGTVCIKTRCSVCLIIEKAKWLIRKYTEFIKSHQAESPFEQKLRVRRELTGEP